MNTQSIQARRSVRTYSGEAISEDILSKIEIFLERNDNPFGVPITFQVIDARKHKVSSPVILGADIYVAGKYKKSKNAELAFGYEFEKFVLYAASLGLGTVWLAATFDRKAFENAVFLKEDEVMPAVTPVGYAAEKPSLRESLMRKGLKADERLPFETLFFSNDFSQALKAEEANIWRSPLEMVRLAPSATNKQPWRVVVEERKAHFFEKKTKGYARESTGDIQKVDLGIAMCHFEIAAAESGLIGKFIQINPELALEEDIEYIATYELEV